MAAYVIVEIETHDPELMASYRELAKPIVEAHGGRYLARGGPSELLEGTDPPERVVVLSPRVSIARASEGVVGVR